LKIGKRNEKKREQKRKEKEKGKTEKSGKMKEENKRDLKLPDLMEVNHDFTDFLWK